MKSTNKTDVLFLIEQPLSDLEPSVFAFFPNEAESVDLKMCYAHLGQHSSCHIDYANECKQATQEQYNDLLKELESIGYNLNVLNK
jgi:hypothetical protein